MKTWVETRKNFSGKVERLNCELVAGEDCFTILKHTVETECQKGKLSITPGNITYRFHWPNRSYNLVKIFNQDGTLLANCFHLADSVELQQSAIAWRDLNVGILVLPNGATQEIKGNERPALSETWLHIFIEASKQELFRKYQEIIGETDRMLQKYQASLPSN